MEIIAALITGAMTGWLGSVIFRGSRLGVTGNILAGIPGFFVGGWLLGRLGISLGKGASGALLSGALGAIVILAILHLIFRRRV